MFFRRGEGKLSSYDSGLNMKKNRLCAAFLLAAVLATIAAILCLVMLAVYLSSRMQTAPAPTTTSTPTLASSMTPTQTAAITATLEPTALPGSAVGAPGIGDPYFPAMGNGGYDVQHYDLDLKVDMDRKSLSADAVITARTTQELGRFNLDFSGLEVESVTVDGQEAAFARSPGELVITPAEILPADTDFTVAVAYSGTPREGESAGYLGGWSFYTDGVIVAGEPDGAETWFPVNNHPLDKATYSFTVTVEDSFIVAANGVLRNATDNGDGTVTYIWDMDDPMASYLATIAIGRFDVIQETSAAGIPIRSYITPLMRKGVEKNIHRIPEMLDYLQSLFGAYPFDAGGVVVHNLPMGFALESQTLVVMGAFFSEQVVVHELAHMWFGDSISVADWQDIWLNEGFASYAEVLWLEHTDNRAKADEDIVSRYKLLAGWKKELLQIGNPGPDENNLFSRQVYDRGALTLHALRLRVGDEAFFRILRAYVERFGGGNAHTEDFIAVAEEISGMDLQEFFRQWLFESQLPDIPEMDLHLADFQ